jgi:hypothetical protein
MNIGKLQAIINAKKLLEDEGYQSPRIKPTEKQSDQKHSELIELVDNLATEITELNFGLDTFIGESFTDEAQDYYNEKYDQYEELITNYIKY